MSQKIVTNLWFDDNVEEAIDFYLSVFEDSRLVFKTQYPEGSDKAGQVLTIDFELNGQRFTAINGGPMFKFNEAISLLINCADQDEIDFYWEKLGDGGEHGPCGWLKDRYGLSWQVVPEGMDEVYKSDDPARARRAFEAMMTMGKLDVAALRAAADGEAVPAG